MVGEKEVLVDEGYATFVVGSIELRVDVFQSFNKIAELTAANLTPNALHEAIRQHMLQIGLPAGSDQLCVAFAERISKRVNDLKKSDGAGDTQKSQDSITSTPSGSAA